MTVAELLELSQMAFSNGLAAYAIFLTIVGGYLVAAYMVGRELQTSQYVILNGLFLVIGTSTILTVAAYFTTATRYALMATEIDPRIVVLTNYYIVVAVTVMNFFAVVAGIKFMRDTRKNGIGT